MHPYIPHLLADIENAHRSEKPYEPEKPISIEEQLQEIEKWVEGREEDHTFGYYFGLKSIDFPPAAQLTEKEMNLVLTAFHKMMFSWNIDISLPDLLPVPIAYAMTVETLDTKTAIVNSGFIGFDFCTGNAPDCVFKEYCPCLKIWNEMDDARFNEKSP